MSEAATLTAESIPTLTPLAAYLQSELPGLIMQDYAGGLTPRSFSDQPEIPATLTAACFDLGYRTRIRVTGEDRLRWLNGMVSNSIQALPFSTDGGHGNYNFILNAQGRIQGDAYVYRRANDLLIDTDRSQSARLFAHLDHFIIMDDVELHPLDETTTGIALIGPKAAETLAAWSIGAQQLEPLQFVEAALSGIPVTVVRGHSVLLPRFELWFAPEDAIAVWKALTAVGATPIGVEAVEALRILEGTPRYGVDITDRHLPQETAQTRALNFSKGCYLGQEIVERIRSRATVHRTIQQFKLEGDTPATPVELRVEGETTTTVGQLTSVAEIRLPDFSDVVAIGSIRTEALERKSPIVYAGGIATALDHPPIPPRP